MKEPLDMLSDIKSVEVPPFLWTRIRQRIKTEQENRLSPAFAYLLGISFLLLMGLNMLVITEKTYHTVSEINSIAQTMNLLPNNTLYK